MEPAALDANNSCRFGGLSVLGQLGKQLRRAQGLGSGVWGLSLMSVVFLALFGSSQRLHLHFGSKDEACW